MSELQAILERRRRRADATRDDDGDEGPDADDVGAAAAAVSVQQQQQPYQQYSQSYVDEDDNGEGGRVEVRPSSAGRAAMRLTPPSQLPSRVHSSSKTANAGAGVMMIGGRGDKNSSIARAKVEGSVAYRGKLSSVSSSISSSSPQDELQKKLLERRMKFSGESGAEETKSNIPEDEEVEEVGGTIPSSHIASKWNSESMNNTPNDATNPGKTKKETMKKPPTNNVKFEWNNRTKRLEPVVQVTANDDINNPVTSNVVSTAQSLPIPQSQPSSSAAASSSRTGGFFKRTSPPSNSTTKPIYGTANVSANRQLTLPPQQQQQPPHALQQQQQQPQQVSGRPSSSYSNSHQVDHARRTVAGRGGGVRGGTRRGAPQSSPPVSMLSSMAAKYKEEMLDQSKEEEEKEKGYQIVVEKRERLDQDSMELMTQRYKERTTDSWQRGEQKQQQRKAIAVKSTKDVELPQSQPQIPSTPPRRSNVVGPTKVLPATTTASDDGSANVPEFMRMRLRSTPNKRRFSGDDDMDKVPVVAAPPKSRNALQQQQQQQQAMTAENNREKQWQQPPPTTTTTAAAAAASAIAATSEAKSAESMPGQQHRQRQLQSSMGDASARAGRMWQQHPTPAAANNPPWIQIEQQQHEEDAMNAEKQMIAGNGQQQQHQNRFSLNTPNIYDTAVMAAKNAIDMSNRSRARPWMSNHATDRSPQSLGNLSAVSGASINGNGLKVGGLSGPQDSDIDESYDARDPSLMIEPSPDPSPSSSLVMEEEVEEAAEVDNLPGGGRPHPSVERPEKPRMDASRGRGGDGKSNVKDDRISRLANLLATDKYDDVVPTTPSAVDAPSQLLNVASNTPSNGNDPQMMVSGDERGGHKAKDDYFFGATLTDSEDASHNVQPSQQSLTSTQNGSPSPPPTDIVDGDVLDNAFLSDPFASTAEFGMAISSNDGIFFSRTIAIDNDQSQPSPPERYNSTHATVADLSQQPPLHEESDTSVNEDDPGKDHPEGVVSFDEENNDYAAGEEFVVDVQNFTDGIVGSSLGEDVVIPSKQPVLTNLHDSQSRQLVGSNRRDMPAVASFHVRELDFASAYGSHCAAEPIQNPLSGNMIRCRRRNGGGEFVIEEIDVNNRQLSPSTSSSIASALVVLGQISTDEIEVKLTRSTSIGNYASGGGNDIKVLGVSSILSLAAGVHRVKGNARVRVAVLAEICVLSSGVSKVNNRGGIGTTIRIVAVWRWGYNTSRANLSTLQSVLTMDSIDTVNSRCRYDPKTLQVADGLLFLGGRIAGRDADSIEPTSTAAVFIAKPSVRNFWISVPLGNTNAVSTKSLAATNDAHPYLAVGLSDGSVHVLTYGMAARTNRLNIHKQNASLLYTLYCMHGELDVRRLSDEDCLWPEQDSLADQRGPEHSPASLYMYEGESGYCASLSWIEHNSSGISSLPLLAASFSSGIAIYLVATSSNQATRSAPTIITPLAQAKFFSSHEAEATNITPPKPRTKISWCDLGPRSPPCLTLLFESETHSYQSGSMELLSRSSFIRLCLCAVDIPWYGSIEMASFEGANFRHRPIGVIAQKELNDCNGGAVSIVSSTAMGVVMCNSGRIMEYEPILSMANTVNEDHFSSLLRPVASAALGLDSDGSVYVGCAKAADTQEYSDVMLSVFSVATCGNIAPPMTAKDNSWSMPSLRHWLLISSPGDGESEGFFREPSSHLAGGELARGNDAIKGGASTDILFELTCGENPVAGLIPTRIAKEDCGGRVAVMFSSGFFVGNAFSADDNNEQKRVRPQTKISTDAVAYTILDIENGVHNQGSTSFILRHGRDVAFLQPSQTDDGFYCSSLVVLEADGSAISLVTAISSRALRHGENERIVEPIEKCSLQYEGIEGHRVFTLLNGNHPEILVAGYCKAAGLQCLLLTKHSLERSSSSNQMMLVENSGMGLRLWLRRGENIISAQELPRHGKARRANVAVASQERVVIVSPDDSLAILAEIDVHLTCTSLSSLGSHCVAFCAASGPSCRGRSQVMYLSCLEDVGSYGTIVNTPTPQHGRGPTLLSAIRPDRVVYLNSHSGLRIVDKDDDEHTFVAPLPCTRPALLLEPLIANALCQDGSRGANASVDSAVQRSLRTIIEKFGRKDMSSPHGDNQGIGANGAGVTSQVYKMLARHKCIQAASILLTGGSPGESSLLSKLMPPCVPIQSKLSATFKDIMIQALCGGDDNQDNCAYLRPPDMSSIMAEELAFDVLKGSSTFEASNLLDLAGRQSSESLLAQLALSADSMKLLKDIDDSSDNRADSINNCAKLCSSIGVQLMQRRHNGTLTGTEDSNIPVSQLAPSVQSTSNVERIRNAIIGKDVIESVAPPMSSIHSTDAAWKQTLAKGKHIWSTGPLGNQENLLELNDFEDWLGRCCPAVLGKDSVAIAATTGERTLADILSAAARDEEEFGAVATGNELSPSSRKQRWVEGVGEGRSDEDNLSLYIRFSEGADEDVNWKSDGFTDLTKYAHVARLYGGDLATVEATTSSVDEGEEGKVRLLFDLVYHERAPREKPTGLVVEAPRGGSLDVGMLHGAQYSSRKRCTIELWYHLPQAHVMTDEIILVRRSLLYEENDDASKLCMPDEKHNTLWELAVLPTGLLELRSGAGSVVTSATYADDIDDGIVSWEREDGGGGWNHLCLVMSSLSNSKATEFSASILMNGSVVVPGAILSVSPFGSDPGHELRQVEIDESMERSVLIFGIGPSIGYRMTDLRVWACQRSEDDIKTMMYEYLRDAEMKKKLKVNIRKGAKKVTDQNIAPIRLRQPESKKGFALAPPPKSPAQKNVPIQEIADSLAETDFMPFATFPIDLEDAPNTMNNDPPVHVPNGEEVASLASPILVEEQAEEEPEQTDRLEPPSFEVTYSDLLSSQVRKSAASAIIRGPPAARHFGGNRGGLLSEHINFGSKCDGVSPIAICGADKSVVWFSDRDPPGKTFPVGASGAVLSDVMDEDQSEYMCCFLAKEKRMVVFELSRKTVLVELQMKTKLNFWRYLPPEAHGSDLVFVLITPIGGFHWKPLDKMPRPIQVWKRGLELESKKILTYEEGGSNGLTGANVRSTVALVTVSSSTPESTSVEAYCIAMYSGSSLLCISNVILGAALYRPTAFAASSSSPCHFLPYVITISKDVTSQLVLDIESLIEESGTLARGSIVASTVLDFGDVNMDTEMFEPPSLSMGHTPEVLCCCHNGFIVAAVRRSGFVFVYDFSGDGDIILIGQNRLGHYIVDAAIRSCDGEDDDQDAAELVLLLSNDGDSMDGRAATVQIRRLDEVSHSTSFNSVRNMSSQSSKSEKWFASV
ncbi:hypothetical protein ACHAXH_002811 [Discostella pseudostelligera]